MTTSKSTKAIYWSATIIIFIFDGVIPALTSHTELAVEGIRHLGYPDYFRVLLTVFKVVGALALVLPFVSARLKEWAYVGFGISMIAAFVSHWAVDGPGGQTFFPLIVLGILVTSYVYYHKLVRIKAERKLSIKTPKYVLSTVPQ